MSYIITKVTGAGYTSSPFNLCSDRLSVTLVDNFVATLVEIRPFFDKGYDKGSRSKFLDRLNTLK